MKLLFLGSAISQESSDYITLNSKSKPSVAPVNFQRNMIKGLSKYIDKSDFSILSLPPVAMFPGGCYFAWGKKKDRLFDNKIDWIPTLNLPVLKQITAFISTFWLLVKWWFKNKKEQDKIVLVYGQTLYTNLAQIIFCKLFKVKSCCIVTDPIRYWSDMDLLSRLKRTLIRIQWKITEKIKKEYSSFVFLTEYMVKDYIEEDRPYIILEGIADLEIFDGIDNTKKAKPPVIMYSGAISTGFGLPRLFESLQYTNKDFRLWIFGTGTDKGAIRKTEASDKRLKYWGKVPWNELLTHMKEATLLLSVKPVDAEHSAYQFPSKIMEYMASGTPVLSTRVKGIPDEYFDYVYPIEEDTAEGFARAIDDLLDKSDRDLREKGEKARDFLKQKKNCYFQAERIVSLLKSVL